MADIRQNVQKDAFKTLAAFDHAVHDLFRWARRVYPIGSQEYGDVALLQVCGLGLSLDPLHTL